MGENVPVARSLSKLTELKRRGIPPHDSMISGDSGLSRERGGRGPYKACASGSAKHGLQTRHWLASSVAEVAPPGRDEDRSERRHNEQEWHDERDPASNPDRWRRPRHAA